MSFSGTNTQVFSFTSTIITNKNIQWYDFYQSLACSATASIAGFFEVLRLGLGVNKSWGKIVRIDSDITCMSVISLVFDLIFISPSRRTIEPLLGMPLFWMVELYLGLPKAKKFLLSLLQNQNMLLLMLPRKLFGFVLSSLKSSTPLLNWQPICHCTY